MRAQASGLRAAQAGRGTVEFQASVNVTDLDSAFGAASRSLGDGSAH